LYVIRPSHIEKPPVVLYLYSYPSDTHRFLDNAYCQRVTGDGFAAVGFVSALTGQRYHGRPMKQWFVSELQESLVLSVHDVQMVLNYLARRGVWTWVRPECSGRAQVGVLPFWPRRSTSVLRLSISSIRGVTGQTGWRSPP
jgi:hypothetical protein